MMQRSGPIGRTIDCWQEKKTTRLSMPGHKGNETKLSALSRTRDVTELPGFDDLHAPCGCIAESERQIADIYGVHKSYFLVNGASGGLKAALLAIKDDVKTIRIPRNAHKSVWQGCLLAGIEPVYVQPEFRDGLMLPPGVQAYLDEAADASLLLTTSYEGAVRDYKELSEKGTLIADEAHGSHLPFCGITSAVSYADIVVHGTHKTLGSLTQSGLLHSNNAALTQRLRDALSLVESTSPSWLLLSSVEEAVLYWQDMLERGELDRLRERCLCLRERVDQVPGFRIPKEHDCVTWDPLHLCIQTEDGLNGRELLFLLDREYAVDLEMALDGHVVGLLGPFDSPEADEILLKALGEISRERGLADRFERRESLTWPRTKQVASLAEAHRADKHPVALAQAAGCIAADAVSAYPPGIPLLLPGEEISLEICETLMDWQSQGVWIEGMDEGKIKVIED